ncbi:hypothetical protein DICPUDRAFT_146788 [Dictyostelium purpureum]|uniref:Uncharacterized protein n=1 Tax=Dictyostelium purpureum TaxID=5786 RepID=F0Z6R7_DICPU|nr:uncharacterized protein DICPUDRAFT_146788 [Dictyostelium purpureum]EGC40409.1 hypothetical protein DICPUDRAFT_146788 [Dictyostelium purpureum]|eukprot:XP_003283160.1 hypothetical protein DICPUDRAFT_146788 [Dictyostelium purpureum]
MIEALNGEVTVPYELYQQIQLDSKGSNVNYLISSASYKITSKSGIAQFDCEFQIRVFNNKNKSNNNTVVTKESIKLISQKATILNSSIKYCKSNTGDNWTSGESLGACILTADHSYYLYTSAPGRYTITLECSLPYLTVKEAGFEVSIPECSNNSVFVRVPQKNANIKVFNSFLDTEAFDMWSEKHSKDANDYTVTFVKLANDTILKAQWTINDDFISNKIQLNNNNNNVPKVNVKPNVIVSQSILGSIGEGLLLLKCQFDYKIIAGNLSLFNIEIQDDINIVNVECQALKRWEVLALESPTSPSHNRVVQITLDYGFDSDFTINMNAEYSMKDTSGEINIPSMICKGDEINRQRGYLGIEARTNVEISDIGNLGLSVTDIKELPIQLSSMASHPILLSYKYLEPDFQLRLKVKRNNDVAVLVSICEGAHFITTCSDSGKLVHQIILQIKNTQKQFIRLRLPFEYEIWTTMMDGEPIRPSYSDPFLLIPILKPGVFDQNVAIKIEIVLLQKDAHNFNRQSNTGRFGFTLPKIDLPLRAVFATICLPRGVHCSDFTGNLKNVPYFQIPAPSSSASDSNPAPGQSHRRKNLNRRESIDFSDKAKKSHSFLSKSSAPVPNKRQGVIPVTVEMPNTNNTFFFEQILLSGDRDLSFGFNYKINNQLVQA